jgi:serine/threonine-protein kinase HipA
MALAAGIEMTACRLLEEGGRAHFMTRRFDRAIDGRKIHTQTLCALSHLDFRQIGVHDYAQLFLLLSQLGLGPETRQEVFRRMTFNVAAAICDDHTKNFSFLLPEHGDWQLSPAYDVTHAHAPSSKWTRQHLMAVNGRTIGITRRDLMQVGDLFAVPAASDVYEEVLKAVANWRNFADEANVPDITTNQIAVDIDTWSNALLS